MLSDDVDAAGDRRHPFPVHPLFPWVFPIGSAVVFEVGPNSCFRGAYGEGVTGLPMLKAGRSQSQND